MLILIAPLSKKHPVRLDNQDSDSEPENISVARTSTPVKIINATSSKTTPINSRNNNEVGTFSGAPSSSNYLNARFVGIRKNATQMVIFIPINNKL